MDWSPFLLSFKLALLTALVLLLIGIPLAYALSFVNWRGKRLVQALIALPMVLPPTVLGFYFLLVFSPQSSIGTFLNSFFDLQLVFSFSGLLLGSIIYSLPFMVQPIQNAFEQLPNDMLQFARVLGKGKWAIFKKIILPNSVKGIATGLVLSFAHTLGEFGLVLMIGGNIPNETRVASIAIYESVELMQMEQANQYALILLLISFVVLVFIYSLGNNSKRLVRW
ncbi:MAG: molybdate ABC transporter permease subunit [Saprospiraceae bacterium]|nr:molybdate ABC transporter permease subunit [Saprospiraceae bacterium]